ncbi:hypothetical protein [uncultured Tenacibaculum sp.]|uniref:DUF6970 domain-containing protein n=1 Tax=uncultured Tenacibaculum sp. TaxID=174713 RepID=UPI00262C1169|nr:hypothetical protein [uncultured Tenacibaculum sp.]
MKRVFYSLIISLSLFACSKQEYHTDKYAINPLENLEWLKQKKENFERLMNSVKVEILLFKYLEERVYVINDCVNCTDALTKVYNERGEVICEFGGIAGVNTCPDFQDNAQFLGVLWRNYNKLLIDNTRYENTSSDNYTITDVSIENNILTINISSSGCSGDLWIINLIDSGEVSESFPPKRNLRLELINNEACLAVFSREIQFNLTELRVTDANQILLQLENWDQEINYNY